MSEQEPQKPRTSLERAAVAKAALDDGWRTKPGAALQQTRGDLTVIIDREPESIAGGRGVRFHCQLLRDGKPVAGFDPIRQIINPPTQVPDETLPKRVVEVSDVGQRETIELTGLRYDPMAAMWAALWDNVESTIQPDRSGRR